jgi:hypothetical protein
MNPCRMVANSFRENFWERVCGLYDIFVMGALVTIVLLALSLVIYILIEGRGATYTIIQVNIIMLTGLLIGLSIPIYYCRNK